MSGFSNLICRLNTITIKIPVRYSVDSDKLVLKFIWREKKTQNIQHNIEEEEC